MRRGRLHVFAHAVGGSSAYGVWKLTGLQSSREARVVERVRLAVVWSVVQIATTHALAEFAIRDAVEHVPVPELVN
jgi:3-dehydroquinate dehydratase|eukprot:COSAG06_NODE_793_length_12267_cov_130.512738_5_plen_76_part_00